MDRQRWQALTFYQQMGHIGSEIQRAKNWEDRANLESRGQALERALELVELTIDLSSTAHRRELARFREMLCHCIVRSDVYQVSLGDLQRYVVQPLTNPSE